MSHDHWHRGASHSTWAADSAVRTSRFVTVVVFLGGGVTVSVGRPLFWAPLGWGEPVIPWWGRPGFIGVAFWTIVRPTPRLPPERRN